MAAAVLLGCSAETLAGSVANVTVNHIEALPSGHFFVYFSSSITSSPACATLPATAFVVDGSTAGGKVVVALIQEAYALGKTISGSGSNTCTLHTGYETISDIFTTN